MKPVDDQAADKRSKDINAKRVRSSGYEVPEEQEEHEELVSRNLALNLEQDSAYHSPYKNYSHRTTE